MEVKQSQKTESLYIHWPFCPYRCHYCPFVALAGHDNFMEVYHKALKKEIEDYALSLSSKTSLNTIYFGGGTPSTYPEKLLLDMFGILNSRFDHSLKPEITLEVNPGTVTLEKIKLWHKVGINRLSIGVQSLNTKVLKDLNRHQDNKDISWLISTAIKYINNISIDLIVGLPGISKNEWCSIVDTISTWPIKHVSMYFLTVHEDTPLYFGVKTNKVILPKDKSVVESYYYAVDKLKRAGLKQYEISSFAKPGYESKHNKVYWNRKPFRGFGLGSFSFDGIYRWQNQKNLMKYIEGVNNNHDLKTSIDQPDQNQIWLERLMLGLRQRQGVYLPEVIEKLDQRQKSKFKEKIKHLLDIGFIKIINNYASLTSKGLPVVNEIIVKLSESY